MIEENRQEFELTNVLKWQKDNLGEGVTIVVLDKGDTPYDYMKQQVIVPFEDEKIDRDHGTAVIAIGYQIAPKVKIILMPFIDNNKKPEIIDWIFEHKDEIDLINCSFTGVDKELERLEELDIPLICGSGNDYSRRSVGYPAKYSWTVAVGSFSAYFGSVDDYSNWGKDLDCVAPSHIYYLNSQGKEVQQSGTSISTPFVTFSLALYLSWRKRNNLPKLSREEIKKFINENAKDLYEEGHDYRSGYGLFRLPERIPEIKKEEDNMPKDYFNDDDNRWSEEFNNELASLGILEGDGKGNFRPTDIVTREELSKVAVMLRKNILDEVRVMLGK